MNFPPAIGFDVETTGEHPGYGLQPFRALSGEAHITAASFARGDKVTGLLKPSGDTIASVIGACADQGVRLVGWNVAFDAAWCIAAGAEDEVLRAKWLDGMLLWRHWCVEPEGDDIPKKKHKSFALEAALKEFFPNDADFKEFDDFDAIDQASLERLLERNKGDALFTLKLAELFWSKLNDRQQTAAVIEAQCIPLIALTKVIGLCADREKAVELSRDLEVKYLDMLTTLNESSPETKGLNLGSPKQLQTLLFETWGLPVQGLSKKTQLPSTDKFALFDLAAIDPRAKVVKELRELKNNRTKYAEATIKSLDYNGDGCVRPGAKIFSTYTSRMTYSSKDTVKAKVEKTTKAKGLHLVEKDVTLQTGIALHQWKRGREFRDLIVAPEGYTLTEFDFAGQEFRWMAVASEDDTMLSLCQTGEDAHSFMGAQVARRDYRELMAAVKAGDADAANERKSGKFCIAEGQLVLTDKGLVPIEDVSLDHRVWDGVEWVSHEGLIYQGVKGVITYEGLTATPDHEVYTESNGCMRLDDAAAKNYRLLRSGDGWGEVRVDDYHISQYKARYEEAGYLRALPLPVRGEAVGVWRESRLREIDEMQELCIEGTAFQERSYSSSRQKDSTCPKAMQRDAPEVREQERRSLQELRRQRDKISVREHSLCCEVHIERADSRDLCWCGHRQDRQQLPLRKREPETVHKGRKPQQQKDKQVRGLQRCESPQKPCIPCSTNHRRGCEIRPRRDEEFGIVRIYDPADHRQVAQIKKHEERTFDLTNAGPRHRFTVSNCLIFNCNLSYQYRVSSKTATKKARVEYGLDVSTAFIQRTQNIYSQSYRGVEKYWSSQIQKCKLARYAETYAGRRVQLPGRWYGKDAWGNESTAINYPIQGTGGDQKYLAIAVARNHLNQFGGKLYMELHDGLFFIFPDDKVDAAIPFFRNLLSSLPYKQAWGHTFPINFPVDSKKGPSWGGLVEVE